MRGIMKTGVAMRIIGVLALLGSAAGATAVDSLYYREIARDGCIYVFDDTEAADRFEKTGEMEGAITRVGGGEHGETLVAESERALELYFFRHGISEPAAPPPPPAPAAASWRIHGLVVGDYYWVAGHHDPR